MSATQISSSSPTRYPVLDALRFFLAFWVTMGHYRVFPLFVGANEATRLGRFLIHGWSSIVFGTPAVIGFFVISGFCIHLPFRGQEKLLVGRYYARRYSRTLIPLGAAFIVFRLSGMRMIWTGKDSVIWHSLLWSLVCEEIYYAIYPLVRIIRRKTGWAILLPCTFLASVIISGSKPNAVDWFVYGPLQTALILFPVWLLGCVVAEQIDDLVALESGMEIWAWRFSIWAASWACEMMQFKSRYHSPRTMLWFGILAYFWIKKELAYNRHKASWGFLVAGGTWSYSLYLIHPAATSIIDKLQFPSFGYLVSWSAAYAFIFGMSYLFYLLVERPSHRMARKIVAIGVREAPAAETGALPQVA
jgi:peptidoglycan/LPS O-acetylase OafA/YrhL